METQSFLRGNDCVSYRCYFKIITTAPAVMSNPPIITRGVRDSCNRMAARMMVNTTLSLSIGQWKLIIYKNIINLIC